MNFIKAIQHATIGYGIRQKGWPDGQFLSLDNFSNLWWSKGIDSAERPVKFNAEDIQFDLQYEDLNSDSWEIV